MVGPKSLRVRLLLGIATTLLLSWLIQFSLYWADVIRENTGGRDRDLMSTAQIALLSAAAASGHLSTDGALGPPNRQWFSPSGKHVMIALDLASGRTIFSSQGAPHDPLAQLGEDGFSTRFVDGDGWRVYSEVDPESQTQMVVAASLSHYQQLFNDRFTLGAIITLVLVLSVGGGALVISSVTLKPVSAITRALRQRHATDLSPLCEKQVPIEVRPLIVAFNQQHALLKSVLENERNFLSNAAHELRTPLAVLTVQTENALHTEDLPELKTQLKKMAQTTQRSARLVEQLLDLARMESGDVESQMTAIALEEITELVARDLHTIATEKNQRLVMDLQPCRVLGHVDLLGILIRNLLDNACRYSAQDGTVLVQCAETAGRVILTVLDDGPGVPFPERSRIFERFYRVPGSIEPGSGIGLSLVARIADRHQATIEVGTGIGGQGASFSVSFDALRVAAALR